MAGAKKVTIAALIAAAVGVVGWRRRLQLFYIWATWRESRK
ncbi:hypothetical protein [Streptomyces sp. NPDC020917]